MFQTKEYFSVKMHGALFSMGQNGDVGSNLTDFFGCSVATTKLTLQRNKSLGRTMSKKCLVRSVWSTLKKVSKGGIIAIIPSSSGIGS
jgi:hypothetical protein